MDKNSVFLYIYYYHCLGNAFITRLPECGNYYANFTISKTDTFYQGIFITRTYNITIHECALSCILSAADCMFVNYQYLNNTCNQQKLLLLGDYRAEEQLDVIGWKYLSPDYTSTKRGPICMSKNPCTKNQVCYDDCTAQQYKCVEPTEASLTIDMQPYVSDTSKITDNMLGTSILTDSNAGNGNEDQWIRLDLGSDKYILYIKSKLSTSYDHLKIRIGSETNILLNDVCFTTEIVPAAERHYFCSNGTVLGRYIFISKPNMKFPIRVYEIKIFLLY